MKLKKLTLLFCILAIVACAPTRLVETLDKGESAVGVSFGGPLINFSGLTIPVPFSTVYGAYGVHDRISLYGGLHTTSLLYGNLQMDAGALFKLIEPNKNNLLPGITVGVSGQSIWHWESSNYRLYPAFDVNAYWQYGEKKNLLYIGVGSWIDYYSNAAWNQTDHNNLPTGLHLGHTWRRRNGWDIQTEIKWLGIGIDNSKIVVDYVTPTSSGALGLFVGVQKRF